MEITIVTPKTYFKDLKEGIIFMSANNSLYVKMDRIGEYNAVRLNDGQLAGFGNEEIVTEVKKVDVML